MNTRSALLVVPLVLAGVALSGCNLTGAAGKGTGSVGTVHAPATTTNTEVCHMPAWIRERAPEGVCTTAPDVQDDLNLGELHQERMQQ
ncbi:hypothetical protein ACGGZK_06535 [Agromyces sp. MMS24-K17]|uniref:hypothetical protein n=1 Tax=Agromyces sp. MMS24-K17 TaxID=3372850 RepID=UPI0037545243